MRGCACHTTEGYVHVSCLAEQAKILCDDAEENNLRGKAKNARWSRWHTCSLCEQQHHGVVAGALGWACWKTYVSRPEADRCRRVAMGVLANGLYYANRHEDALSVKEAELSMEQRLGGSETNILSVQSNLSNSYHSLGRFDDALRLRREVYSGRLKLNGEENEDTLRVANNYAVSLITLRRFGEVKLLLRKMIPVARRVLGENHDLTLRMRQIYAKALYRDPSSTLDDLREAVATLEDAGRIARRVFGGAHPLAAAIEESLRRSRDKLRARKETASP